MLDEEARRQSLRVIDLIIQRITVFTDSTGRTSLPLLRMSGTCWNVKGSESDLLCCSESAGSVSWRMSDAYGRNKKGHSSEKVKRDDACDSKWN